MSYQKIQRSKKSKIIRREYRIQDRLNVLFFVHLFLCILGLSSLEGTQNSSFILALFDLLLFTLVGLLAWRSRIKLNWFEVVSLGLCLLVPTILFHPKQVTIVVKFLLLTLPILILYKSVHLSWLTRKPGKVCMKIAVGLIFLSLLAAAFFRIGEVHSGGFFGSRYYGIFGDSVSIFVYASWVYFSLTRDKQWQSLSVVMVVLTGSKISAVLVGLDLLRKLYYFRKMYAVLVVGSILVASVTVEFLLPERVSYSLNTRALPARWAFEIFKENPIKGLGFNNSSGSISEVNFYELADEGLIYSVTMLDNTILRLLVEYGIFGFLIFMILVKIISSNRGGLKTIMIILLLQTFHWFEPISSAFYSLLLLGCIFELENRREIILKSKKRNVFLKQRDSLGP